MNEVRRKDAMNRKTFSSLWSVLWVMTRERGDEDGDKARGATSQATAKLGAGMLVNATEGEYRYRISSFFWIFPPFTFYQVELPSSASLTCNCSQGDITKEYLPHGEDNNDETPFTLPLWAS